MFKAYTVEEARAVYAEHMAAWVALAKKTPKAFKEECEAFIARCELMPAPATWAMASKWVYETELEGL